MASLIKLVVSNYNEILKDIRDPMVDKWPLMGSPVPILCIVGTYLIFVLKVGPKIMEKRPPFQLKTILILYNASQVIFSLWLTTLGLPLFRDVVFSSDVQMKSETQKQLHIMLSRGAWWYHVAKITELLDTVFFVLRKKQSQVTFLHVYHHTLTVSFSWCYLKLLPGQQGILVGFVNSIVHIIMYSYYFISALGSKYKKYLWWKKYMTWIQLMQFGIVLFYLMLTLFMDDHMSKGLSYFILANNVFFIYLFTDFYRKAYKMKTV